VHRLTNHPLKGLMGLGYAYARLGEHEKAMECIHKLEQRQTIEPDSVVDTDIAAIWFALDDYDKTFYYINQCFEKRIAPVNYFLAYPVFKSLRQDPRYIELKEKTEH